MDSIAFGSDVVLYGVFFIGLLQLVSSLAVVAGGILLVRRGAKLGGALVIASVALGLLDRFGGFVLSRVFPGSGILTFMSYLTLGGRFISECTLAAGLLLIARALK